MFNRFKINFLYTKTAIILIITYFGYKIFNDCIMDTVIALASSYTHKSQAMLCIIFNLYSYGEFAPVVVRANPRGVDGVNSCPS